MMYISVDAKGELFNSNNIGVNTVKKLILVLIAVSSLSATALPSLADDEDYQTRSNNLSSERQNFVSRQRRKEDEERNGLSRFEIGDLMGGSNPEHEDWARSSSRKNCLQCRVMQP
jgi:Ni/Co efflux regulator RcnB